MPRNHTVWDSTLQEQVEIPFTAAEEIERDVDEIKTAARQQSRDAAVQAKKSAAISARNKLKTLGLTDEEIEAL